MGQQSFGPGFDSQRLHRLLQLGHSNSLGTCGVYGTLSRLVNHGQTVGVVDLFLKYTISVREYSNALAQTFTDGE